MKRVLITGMSGTGKSSVLEELAAQGYRTVDTDEAGWKVPGPGGDLVWDEERIGELLATESGAALFVSGTVENQGTFYDRFDHVVLLSAPAEVIVERLATRTTNPYGKHPDELAEVLGYIDTVEPLLRRRATHEIDTSAPLAEVVAEVLRVLEG
jgi:dephospho-CoA kinase